MMDDVREEGELEDGELSDEEEMPPELPPVLTQAPPPDAPKFLTPPVLSVQADIQHDIAAKDDAPALPILEKHEPKNFFQDPGSAFNEDKEGNNVSVALYADTPIDMPPFFLICYPTFKCALP